MTSSMLIMIFWLEAIAYTSQQAEFGTSDESEKRHLTSICHTEFFAVRCGLNEMLVVLGAHYGRMRINRCVRENFGYIGCSDDVTTAMDEFCSGRRSCNVRVLDDTFSDSPPCHEDLNSYLEVEFQCLKVLMPSLGDCQTNFDLIFDPSSAAVHVASPSFLFPPENQCPRRSNPLTSWIFRCRPGQRIKVTLTDFTFSKRNNSSQVVANRSTAVHSCLREYASISDKQDSTNQISICGPSIKRQTSIILSSSNYLRLELNHQTLDINKGRWSPFLLRIETAGCPDEDPPTGGWMMRSEHSLIQGCNHSMLTWRLDCVSKEWRGTRMNCSTVKINRVTEHLIEDHLETFVVSLGVLIAAASFSASFICLVVLLTRKIKQLKRQHDIRRRRNSLDIASTICQHLSY